MSSFAEGMQRLARREMTARVVLRTKPAPVQWRL